MALPAILNVTDDDAKRFALSRVLLKEGFAVWDASTGNEALRRAADNPGLIILDVRLADLSVFEVCRRLKADPATAHIPVLHISAEHIGEEDRARGLAGGAEGYLVEPIETEELLTTVRSLVRLRNAEENLRQAASEARVSAERVEQLERELQELLRVAGPPAATPELPGSATLRDGSPGVFADLVAAYGRLLDDLLDQRSHKVTHHVSERLRVLGDRLCFLRAGARDIVEIHSTALKERIGAQRAKALAFVQEGRLLVLELMGNVLTGYRTQSGVRPDQRPEVQDDHE